MRDDNIRTYQNTLEEIFRDDPAFIMIVISKADQYSVIKRLALCRPNPVLVQVILEKTFKKRNLLSIATKVAIQVNCKLGGIPWMVDLKLAGMLIIGFSISKDTSDRRKSYGAMVASMNPNDSDEEGNPGGKFFSVVTQHDCGEDLSTNFGNNILAALRRYTMCNEGQLPKRILIYRDGVGDGQIQHVIDQELADIRSKVKHVYEKSGHPGTERLGFVLLNKKTNTRLFSQGDTGRQHRPNQRSDYQNPLPGTVVDSVITLPERYDFYLVSPSTNQGSVSPTYYNIIHDEFYACRPEIMQTMTFKLCHLYYNWTGTTCVPSVVQYAKKLAILVGQNMHEIPSPNMPIDKQLYFL